MLTAMVTVPPGYIARAQNRRAVGQFFGHGLALTLAGVALGVVAALALTRVMSGPLFGITATDPSTFATVAALLIAVALLACWLPARRATRVDPVVALRAE